MPTSTPTVTGPHTYEHLALYLLHAPDALDGSRYLPLREALQQRCVVLHETGNVGQLEVENLSPDLDLYIQSGAIVKGGRQDRTLGVDFVLPARSGRTPIPAFCVESGRWHRRGGEDACAFGSSMSYLNHKPLRMAAKLSHNQGEVWDKVAEAQASLGAGIEKPLHAPASPTSYQLSIEDPDLQRRQAAYREALASLLDAHPDAIGFAYAIGGKIDTADLYGSAVLFRKLWDKLLDAAILDAIAAAGPKPGAAPTPPDAPTVQAWLAQCADTAVTDRREVPPRVRMDIRRGGKDVIIDTRDHGIGDALLHQNLMTV